MSADTARSGVARERCGAPANPAQPWSAQPSETRADRLLDYADDDIFLTFVLSGGAHDNLTRQRVSSSLTQALTDMFADPLLLFKGRKCVQLELPGDLEEDRLRGGAWSRFVVTCPTSRVTAVPVTWTELVAHARSGSLLRLAKRSWLTRGAWLVAS